MQSATKFWMGYGLVVFILMYSLNSTAQSKRKRQAKGKTTPPTVGEQVPNNVDAGSPLEPTAEGKISIYDPEFWEGREDRHIYDPKTKKIFWFDRLSQSVFVASVDDVPEIFSPENGNTPPAGVIDVPEISHDTPKVPSLPQTSAADSFQTGLQCTDRPGRRDAQQLLKSTAQIAFPDGSNCTAFRISGSSVMTNNHCVADMADSKRCFPKKSEYEVTESMQKCADKALKKIVGRDLEEPIVVKFVVNGKPMTHNCNRIEATDAKYDYAVIRCPGMDARIPTVKVSEAGLKPNETVTLATWDYGDQRGRGGLKTRLESGRVVSVDDGNMVATVGSQAGNSGSAIFNQNHEVVALNWGAEIINYKKFLMARLNGQNPQGRAQFHTLQNVMRDLRGKSPNLAQEIILASRAAGLKCGGEKPTLQMATPASESPATR